MAFGVGEYMLSFATLVLLALSVPYSHALKIKNKIKTKSVVFLSPKFELGPGSVINVYYNSNFPRGHLAFKRFDAAVVDEAGIPIPLHETHLHHWALLRYRIRIGVPNVDDASQKHHQSNFIHVRNSGVCQGNELGQHYGVGSETRKTPAFVPDPYGIERATLQKLPTALRRDGCSM